MNMLWPEALEPIHDTEIGTSLFKRWIYALQRYKKCHEIHNMPNKMCSNELYFYVFAWQMQAIR